MKPQRPFLMGYFFSHLRRAVPPPPPPSATGTVGADVPPASGRGRCVGRHQGPGLGMGQEARRVVFRGWGQGRGLVCPLPFPSPPWGRRESR